MKTVIFEDVQASTVSVKKCNILYKNYIVYYNNKYYRCYEFAGEYYLCDLGSHGMLNFKDIATKDLFRKLKDNDPDVKIFEFTTVNELMEYYYSNIFKMKNEIVK